MSDVALVEKLVSRHQELRNEISRVIVGQDAVVNEILISIFFRRTLLADWCSRAGKDTNGQYHCQNLRVGL